MLDPNDCWLFLSRSLPASESPGSYTKSRMLPLPHLTFLCSFYTVLPSQSPKSICHYVICLFKTFKGFLLPKQNLNFVTWNSRAVHSGPNIFPQSFLVPLHFHISSRLTLIKITPTILNIGHFLPHLYLSLPQPLYEIQCIMIDPHMTYVETEVHTDQITYQRPSDR